MKTKMLAALLCAVALTGCALAAKKGDQTVLDPKAKSALIKESGNPPSAPGDQTPSHPTAGATTPSQGTKVAQWTLRESGTPGDLFAVVAANGKFFGVGPASTIVSSADGVTWSRQTFSAPLGNEDFNGIAFGNGVFVLAGTSGALYTSSDATTWKVALAGSGHGYSQLVFGHGRFLALAKGYILASTDGVKWSSSDSLPGGEWFRGLSVTTTGFAAVGLHSELLSSTDGLKWSSHKVDLCAVTRCTSPGDLSAVNLAVAGDVYVLSSMGGRGTGPNFYSQDGTSWTPVPGVDNFERIRAAGQLFAAMDTFTKTVYTSTDGRKWSSFDPGPNIKINELASSGQRVVMVGSHGKIWTYDVD